MELLEKTCTPLPSRPHTGQAPSKSRRTCTQSSEAFCSAVQLLTLLVATIQQTGARLPPSDPLCQALKDVRLSVLNMLKAFEGRCASTAQSVADVLFDGHLRSVRGDCLDMRELSHTICKAALQEDAPRGDVCHWLVQLLNTPGLTDRGLWCTSCRAVASFGRCCYCRQELAQAWSSLVEMLDTASLNPGRQESALECLAVLVCDPITKGTIDRHKCLTVVLRHLQSDTTEPAVLQAACYALAALSGEGPEGHKWCIGTDTVDRLLSILRLLRSHVGVQAGVLWALNSVIISDDNEQDHLSEEGLCDVVVGNITRYTQDPDLQLSACLCLALLAHKNPSNAILLRDTCPLLPCVVKTHNMKPRVLTSVCLAVISLCCLHETRRALVGAGCCDALMAAVQCCGDDEQLHLYGTRAIDLLILVNVHADRSLVTRALELTKQSEERMHDNRDLMMCSAAFRVTAMVLREDARVLDPALTVMVAEAGHWVLSMQGRSYDEPAVRRDAVPGVPPPRPVHVGILSRKATERWRKPK